MANKPMNSNGPKYIGLRISEGILSVIELNLGTIYTEDISAALPVPYWQDPEALQTVLQTVFKATGISWVRSYVLVCVPPDITEQGKHAIFEPMIQLKPKQIYIAEEFFVAALGAGVYQQNSTTATGKKFFLLVKKETSCLGIVFAGSALHLQVIPKGYDDLAIDDLRSALNKILHNLTPELPQQLKDIPIPKEDLGLIEKAWQAESEKRIFISVSKQNKKSWGETLDEYQIVYTEEGEKAVNKGLSMFLSQLA